MMPLQRMNYANIILLVCIWLLALNIPISQTEAQKYQCPVATWRIYDDSCYRLSTRSDTYNDAVKACVDEGAVLTSILTSDEQSFLTDMAEQKEVWIGLNDKKKEGNFKWVDGSNYEYTHWENGQPNDGCLVCFSQDCVHMKSNGEWNDESCGDRRKYICKSQAIPLPTTTEDTFTDHTSAVSSQGLITSTTTTFNPGITSSSYSETPDQPELTSEYISTPLTEPRPTATDSRSIGPGGPDKQRDSPPTGLIAGVLVGAVLLIVIVVILVLWCRRSRSTQYPMKEHDSPSGQAYVGPYELTIDGINDGVVIQSNDNVKYETNTINDETPTAYENLSTIQQHQEITSGDNVYAAVDENGANSPSGFDNQVSVIYAKPIKNNLKQLHHEESTLPSNPEDAATDVKSDSAKGLCEGSLSPASVQRECNEEEEGWHDNELYGDLNEGDVDEDLNAMAMQHMSETPAANVKEDATNSDADADSDEGTGWEDNVIYGETQHTPDTV